MNKRTLQIQLLEISLQHLPSKLFSLALAMCLYIGFLILLLLEFAQH